jgi:hypothetical protein
MTSTIKMYPIFGKLFVKTLLLLWRISTCSTTILKLNDEAVFDFCTHLPDMSSLRCITMYGHPFTPLASEWLMRALECNTSLEAAALGACTTAETQNRIRHYLHLNRAGRRACRDDRYNPGMWSHLLARAKIICGATTKTLGRALCLSCCRSYNRVLSGLHVVVHE